MNRAKGNQQQAQPQGDKETQKKLRKRELECQALWDTLKDMRQSGQANFSVQAMMQLLEVRALDGKAKRKLNL